ncbi:terminase large subunit [Occallatibacter riparius]|uniref:Terminase large subunit n=1 Tax=Occallatibacter riparius TaxID=1002689 RepID=A0A9J7BPG1_9BACT|nr:terminase TerL endonuclease subunit [Occallatibacter riparius]UWZ84643.1 terminase large subunit [Occallatibacter riparius]
MARRTVAEKYIADVLAGRILTSQHVRRQIERHQRDLKDGAKRGLVFNREAAQDVIDFFPLFLEHYEGEWNGKPFELRPDQQAMLWILYGWKWADTGYRRFKYAYVEQGRGTGKSPLAAGLCIYEFFAFGEPGAQVYIAATDKATAKVVFNAAKQMVENSDYLRARITERGVNNMAIPETASFMEPVSSEDKNLLGRRPSFTVLDELHVHSSSGVWDVFDSASGKRPNSLMFAITNSGFNRETVCWKKREYVVKVLQGIIPDDTWFGWVCGLDEEDIKDPNGWKNEKNWIKACPALGVIIRIEQMRRMAEQAANDPSALNTFLRYQMCVWTSGHSNWMPMDKWDLCNDPIDPAALRGRKCIGGLDLSTTIDISAFVLLFPPAPDDPLWRVLPWFFLPKEAIEKRAKKDQVPYDVWERQGLFTLTEGDVIDYDFIRAKVNEVAGEYEIQEIAYDPYNAQQIVTQLTGDGFTMVPIRQGFLTLNAPTKRLMELVLTHLFAHGGNAVLRWMASNVIVSTDAAGSIKPDKSLIREKIDGIVAIITALARAIVAPEDDGYISPVVRSV